MKMMSISQDVLMVLQSMEQSCLLALEPQDVGAGLPLAASLADAIACWAAEHLQWTACPCGLHYAKLHYVDLRILAVK